MPPHGQAAGERRLLQVVTRGEARDKRDDTYRDRLLVKRKILRNLTLEQVLAAVGGMIGEDLEGRCTVTIPPGR